MRLAFTFLARDAERVAAAYLYSHSRLVQTLPSAREGLEVALVEVTGRDDRDTRYLASNQAARLGSGLYPASDPAATVEDALREAREHGWL